MTTATATIGPARDATAFVLRLFAWGIVFVTFAFLVENYLIHWLGLPGARGVFTGAGGYLAAGVYGLAGVLALAAARNPSPDGLRTSSGTPFRTTWPSRSRNSSSMRRIISR